MEMAAMDQMLTATARIQNAQSVQSAQSARNTRSASGVQEGGKPQEKGKDFDSMVRQRRQEADRGQESGEAVSRTDSAPRNGQQEIPHEQFILAAALLMIPVTVNTVDITGVEPEKNDLAVELKPEFIPEMRIESVADLPVERPAEGGQQALFEGYQREAPEDTRFTAPEEVSEFAERVVLEVPEEENAPEKEETREEEIQWEAPVFGYMDATPVKVSSAPVQESGGAPVELEADDGLEQLAEKIETVLTDAEGNSYVEITLVPESLGKITVHLTHNADGTLHVQFSATSLRATELLQRNSGNLQHLLMSDTRPDVRIEVRNGETAMQRLFVDPDGQGGQEQRQRQRQGQQDQNRREKHQAEDFVGRLRLGLAGIQRV